MKIELVIIALMILIFPVSAQTLSFVDTTAIDEDSGLSSTEVYVYYGNGTFAGVMNSTSELTGIDSGSDLVFILKPNTLTLFNNPDWVLGFASDSFVLIFVVIFAIMMGAAAIVIAIGVVKFVLPKGGRKR